DNSTLIELAAEIGLDVERFSGLLVSETLQQRLLAEIRQTRVMGIDSFPSLVVEKAGVIHPVELNYNDAQAMQQQIEAV
ncbi:MAG: DsbA family protein, partial [Gammaproteobacteria bacterium]|nr:DsbA family protein [Gammaproteobacteria bacterium]